MPTGIISGKFGGGIKFSQHNPTDNILALVLQREILVSVHLENAILAKITG